MLDTLRQARILIVDDNPAIHHDIKEILVRQDRRSERAALDADLFGDTRTTPGPQITFAADSAYQGKEGLELLRKALAANMPYAMAFVDMRMPPGWDGVETIKHLWRADPQLQVVICTAYSDHSWTSIVQQLQARDRLLILKKPFDSVEILQMVHTLAEKWYGQRLLTERLSDLECLVADRTSSLAEANSRLQAQYEERLRLDAALQRGNRLQSLGRLAAGIGHEINNPLAYITSNVDFVLEELRACDDVVWQHLSAEVIEALEDAAEGAGRVKHLVADLKSFSHMDAQGGGLADVKQALDFALKLASREVRQRAMLHCETTRVPLVRANQRRLEQVFVNILTNAAQALPEDAVAANEVRVVLEHVDGQIVVEVSDTGPGIAPEDLERVFDVFFTTKPVGAGTGLGLAICQRIVSNAGGDINIESELGKGTTVRIALPVAADEKAEPASVEEVRAGVWTPPRDMRVLVVDDEPSVLKVLKRALVGCDLTLVASGEEALDVCAREDFDILLCDVMMPDVSGKAIYEALARRQPGWEKRIVFMSGGVYTPEVAEFIENAPNVFLPKPLDLGRIKRLISLRARSQQPQRVLFVDSNRDSMVGLLRQIDGAADWTAHFAISRAETARRLETEHFDVVAAACRMPELGGGEVLRLARERVPSAVRLLAIPDTTSPDLEKVLGVAHQVTRLPWDAPRISELLQRIADTRATMPTEYVQAGCAVEDRLPCLPDSLIRLRSVLADDQCTVDTLASVVGEDPSIAAKLLHFANSGLFGPGHQVSSLNAAIIKLGMGVVRGLVTSLASFSAFDERSEVSTFDLDALRSRSFAVATLASEIFPSGGGGATAFTGGLLSGIGHLVFADWMPEEFGDICERAKQRGLPLHVVEEVTLGVTHASVGAYLLGIWGLPQAIVDAVGRQHRLVAAGERDAEPADAVFVATALVEWAWLPEQRRSSDPFTGLEHAIALLQPEDPSGWPARALQLKRSIVEG